MTCETVRHQLVAFFDRELAEGESKVVERHVVGCGECRAELELVRDVLTLSHFPIQLRAKRGLVRLIQAALRTAHGTHRAWWVSVATWVVSAQSRAAFLLALIVVVAGVSALVFWPRSVIVGTFVRAKTSTGYLTVHDKEGVRDRRPVGPIVGGTAISTHTEQAVSVSLHNGGRVALSPSALVAFEGLERGVFVRSGGAYIEGADLVGHAPLIIRTPHCTMTVPGTEFFIHVAGRRTMITVIDGVCTVTNAHGVATVHGGEQAQIHRDRLPVVIRGQEARLAVQEARLRKPVEEEVLARLSQLEGRAILPWVRRMSALSGLSLVVRDEEALEKERMENLPTGFTVREVIEEVLWPVGWHYSVSLEGMRVRQILKGEYVTPPDYRLERFPFEYRDLIRDFFEALSRKKR